ERDGSEQGGSVHGERLGGVGGLARDYHARSGGKTEGGERGNAGRWRGRAPTPLPAGARRAATPWRQPTGVITRDGLSFHQDIFMGLPGPTLPNGGVARGVKDRQNHHLAGILAVIDAVRVARHQCLPHVLVDLRVEVRLGGDLIQHPLDRRRKRRPEPGSALLVPVRRVIELGSGGSAEDDGKAHRLNPATAPALTCSPGATSLGLAAWSARRRSNSSRCASVSSGGCGSAAMLSQIAVARAIRSSTLIRSMPRACRVGAIVKTSSPYELPTPSYHRPLAEDRRTL